MAHFVDVEQTAVTGPQWTSVAYANRGQIAVVQGDAVNAEKYLDEARPASESLKFTWGLADTLRIPRGLGT